MNIARRVGGVRDRINFLNFERLGLWRRQPKGGNGMEGLRVGRDGKFEGGDGMEGLRVGMGWKV